MVKKVKVKKKQTVEKVEKKDSRISAAAYAKHRGVSKEAVKKAIQQGRIYAHPTGRNGYLIDPVVADKQWADNTKPYTAPGEIADVKVDKYMEGEEQRFNESDLDDPDKSITLNQAKTLKEKYSVRLAKLKWEEESGKLVSADVVKGDAFKMARTVRNLIMNIPDRISAELASITDPFEVNLRLKKELNDCMKTLSEIEIE